MPKDLLFKVNGAFGELRKQSAVLFVLMIPLWLMALRFVLVGLVFWFMFVWPLTKVYEYLTLGDIRARSGEVGARRGGLLGYRQWPVGLRMALFAGFLVAFWGGVYLIFTGRPVFTTTETQEAALGIAVFVVLLVFLGYWVRREFRTQRKLLAARRRAKQVNAILDPQPNRRKWWQKFRRNPDFP